MNYLLDTCTFLWLTLEPAKLSPRAKELLLDDTTQLYLSSASLVEISQKFLRGTISISNNNPYAFVLENRADKFIHSLPVEEMAMRHFQHLPSIHRDPFDRILICQAIEHGLTILTPDENIKRYPIKTEW